MERPAPRFASNDNELTALESIRRRVGASGNTTDQSGIERVRRRVTERTVASEEGGEVRHTDDVEFEGNPSDLTEYFKELYKEMSSRGIERKKIAKAQSELKSITREDLFQYANDPANRILFENKPAEVIALYRLLGYD